jgi:hypothetical protein
MNVFLSHSTANGDTAMMRRRRFFFLYFRVNAARSYHSIEFHPLLARQCRASHFFAPIETGWVANAALPINRPPPKMMMKRRTFLVLFPVSNFHWKIIYSQ